MGSTTRSGLLLAGSLALVVACRKPPSGDPTADWLRDHRRELETVREMLAADHGAVTSIELGFPLGTIRRAGGANGSCGSELRGSSFPWKCSGGRTAASLAEVEAILGVPPGRLKAYEHALPAHGLSPGEPCEPPGSLIFWLEDPDSSPCTGLSNLVWSPSPPSTPPDSGRRCAETTYVALGGGWHREACGKAAK